ncbi:arsenate reductase, partial [Priestia megaterium]
KEEGTNEEKWTFFQRACYQFGERIHCFAETGK